MIRLCRDRQRRHVHRGTHEVWHTFYPEQPPRPAPDSFAALTSFSEVKLSPGGAWTPEPCEEAETLTYVYRGALLQEATTGSSGVLRAGEFQRMTVGPGVQRQETNPSPTHGTHLFRLSLKPAQVGLECSPEQRRFAAAQRHNVLCPVASPDGRNGSIHILPDALIYSSVLAPGHHLVHDLAPNRSAWLHVLHGEATLHDLILTRGDGLGITGEPSLSFTAQGDTEVLIVNLGPVLSPFPDPA